MKSSFKQNNFWAWYVFFLSQFLSLFFFLFDITLMCFFFKKKAVQSTFRMEEMYHSVSQQLDEERKRRATAVQTLTIAENSNADLR